jgi:hypothetical protein
MMKLPWISDGIDGNGNLILREMTQEEFRAYLEEAVYEESGI